MHKSRLISLNTSFSSNVTFTKDKVEIEKIMVEFPTDEKLRIILRYHESITQKWRTIYE